MVLSSVEIFVPMTELRTCKTCKEAKPASESYYAYKGKLRGECKTCCIKKNIAYQVKNEVWKTRFVDKDKKKSYIADYYAKNKPKFDEYRRRFLEKNPHYNRDYMREYVKRNK